MAETNHLEATLAELEARRARLDSAIAEIRMMLGKSGDTSEGGGPTPPIGPQGGGSGGAPIPGAFLGMSIPEAAKKHLAMVRKKLPTKALMAALEAGGLPQSKYTTVYGVLRRREVQIGDLINMQGDWALSDWYPNHPRVKPKATPKPEPVKAKATEKKPKAAKSKPAAKAEIEVKADVVEKESKAAS